MQLFVEDRYSWEKTASIELEEDATQWPRQILTELFRALPEVSEYTPDVRILKANEEQGYALGVVVIANNTNSGLTTTSIAKANIPQALVPIVIKNGKLCPIDTLMSPKGKMFPLSVERLREVLYRPEGFDQLSDDLGDSAVWQQFAPPGALNVGSASAPGGIQYMMGPGMGGTKMSMLDRIEGTVLQRDIDALVDRIEYDERLKSAIAENPAFCNSLVTMLDQRTVTEKMAEGVEAVLASSEPIDVLYARFDDEEGLYEVKSASRNTGTLHHLLLDRGDFLRYAGDKLAAEIDRQGEVLAAPPSARAVVVSGPGGERPRLIETPGFYNVYDATTGQQRTGWVVPRLVDGSGTEVPIALFHCPDGARVQDQIVGSSFYTQLEEPLYSPPNGKGCFTLGRGGHDMVATVEVQVHGAESRDGSTSYRCTDLSSGEDLRVTLQRGSKSIVAFPDRKELVMPATTGFISTAVEIPPLVNRGAEEPSNKLAQLEMHGRLAVNVTDDPSYYVLSMKHLPKLASAFPDALVDIGTAAFALCAVGLGARETQGALQKAAMEGRCEVLAEDLTSLPEPPREKIAERITAVRAIRPGLLKEAAELPDATTVDAVLALDFVNSENVKVFISMIPYLEKSLNKICELVFASRLGLKEIPEAAAARAARGLDDSIRGLKALALRQIQELP